VSEVKVDTISERTAANGVAVDGVTIKDSGLTIPSGGTLTIDSGGTITNNGTASGLGGLIPISETVTSSAAATIDITLPNPSSYSGYLLSCSNFYPVTNSVYLRARVSTDGGSTFISTNNYKGNSTSSISVHRTDVPQQSNSNEPAMFKLEIWNHNNEDSVAGPWISTRGQYTSANNGSTYSVDQQTSYTGTSAVNAFRFYYSSGNIASGARYKLYGIVDT
jgi:hypothetical protein